MTQVEKEKERNRLYHLYWQRDKEFEAAKTKRTVLSILGFAIVYFLIFYKVGDPSGLDILWAFVAALIAAGFHFFVNSLVFLYLFQKGNEESARLEAIKKQIVELENSKE